MRHHFRLLPLLLTSLLATPTAMAGIEDRDHHAATHAGWSDNLTIAGVNALINSGKRPVDIEVISTPSGPRFTVAWVQNTGAFYKKFWWSAGADATTLLNLVVQKQARITDVEVVPTAFGNSYVAILVDNTGRNKKSWWWYYDTSFATIKKQAGLTNSRITDLEAYTSTRGTLYTGLILGNTGPDQKTSYSYTGVTPQTLTSYMNLTGARIWDLDPDGKGKFNAITVKSKGEAHWFYYDRTAAQVDALLSRHGARLIDIEKHQSIFGNRFDIVLANSLNPVSRRVTDLMSSKSDGSVGLLLQQVEPLSTVGLAGHHQDEVFEPAGTMAVLPLMRTVQDIRDKALSTSSIIKLQYRTTILNRCPTLASSTTYVALPLALERMMTQGRYEYARYFTNRYSILGLNNFASSLNMKSTKLNHYLGCKTPPNETTLRDLGRLYAAVIRNKLGSAQQHFWDAHDNNLSGNYYASGYLKTVIDQEASKVGLSSAQKTSFINLCSFAGKGGAYTSSGKYYRSWFSYLQLPCYTHQGVRYRELCSGAFVDGATNGTKATDAAAAGAAEVLREQLHSCMLSLKNHVFGYDKPFGQGCKGSLANAFSHYVDGTPNLGAKVSYTAVAKRSTSSPAMMFVGISRSSWLGASLPIELKFMGAPQCFAHISLDIAVPTSTSSGMAQLKFTMPINKSLIGKKIYTQYFIADLGANLANLTTSNAVESFIGGQK